MSANTQFAEKMKKTALGAAMVAAARGAGQAIATIGTHQTNLPDVSKIGIDGEDHINIGDPSGSTELGQWLAHNASTPFVHPLLGKFDSIESFWHWLKSESRNDVYRGLFGNKLRQSIRADEGMRIDLAKRGMVPNFRVMILLANVIKLEQYPALAEELKKSTLPLDMYYVVGETERNRPAFSPWLVEGFEEMRSALKEERNPNFSKFLDKGTTMETVYQDEINRIEAIRLAIIASKKPETVDTKMAAPAVEDDDTKMAPVVEEREDDLGDDAIAAVVDQAVEQAAQ